MAHNQQFRPSRIASKTYYDSRWLLRMVGLMALTFSATYGGILLLRAFAHLFSLPVVK